MAYDDAAVTGGPYLARVGGDHVVSWISPSPPGTVFQLYVNRVLRYAGTARSVVVWLEPGPVYLQAGAVGPAEAETDFAADLPPLPTGGSHPRLRWQGGRFLASDIDHYDIFRGGNPGDPVDYSRRVARVEAYRFGVVLDGFGVGGFGAGGFGSAALDLDWRDPAPLGPGTWNYAIVPVGAAGGAGSPILLAAEVVAPPEPPGDVRATYDPATHAVVIEWDPA